MSVAGCLSLVIGQINELVGQSGTRQPLEAVELVVRKRLAGGRVNVRHNRDTRGAAAGTLPAGLASKDLGVAIVDLVHVIAGLWAVWHGREGRAAIGNREFQFSQRAAAAELRA